MAAPLHPREPERLELVELVGELRHEQVEAANDCATLANIVCGTRGAVASIIDAKRQWYFGKAGVDGDSERRELTFCQWTLLEDHVMVVPDARLDPRFANNPHVESGAVRFYAGIHIRAQGLPIGTVCVFDSVPVEWTPERDTALRALARQMERFIQFRLLASAMQTTLDNLGSETSRALNNAADVLLNPMAAMALDLAAIRHQHPELTNAVSRIERNLRRTVEAVKGTLEDTFQAP